MSTDRSSPEQSRPDGRGGNQSPEADRDGSAEGPKQEMAEERTDWAKERTLLAKQRTFAAWLRTGLASAGGGFVAAEFLGEVQPYWMVTAASVLLVAAGSTIFVIGYVGYRDTFRKLQKEDVQGIPPWVITGVTTAMLVGVILLLYGVLTR